MKELARRVMHEIQEDVRFGRAAQLAYYFLFALFPSFLFLTTLLGHLPIPNLLDRMMEVLAQVQSGDALRLIQEDLHQVITGDCGGLLSLTGARKPSAQTRSATNPAQAWAHRQDRGAVWEGHAESSLTSRRSS